MLSRLHKIRVADRDLGCITVACGDRGTLVGLPSVQTGLHLFGLLQVLLQNGHVF